MQQFTFKVYPNGRGRDVYRIIRISGSDTLDQLCSAILTSFDFTHDHLYEFCMDNKPYSEHSYQCEPDGSGKPLTTEKIEFTVEYAKPQCLKEKGTIGQYPDPEADFEEEYDDEDCDGEEDEEDDL